MTYEITHDYIEHGNARPGTSLEGPLFGVAHDIGNGGSTAHQNRAYFNNHQPPASAHVFIDDKVILVIIPLNEIAYHVQYQKPYDNLRFGKDANDAAIGVELCWGGGINFTEAYNRYVWFWAWLCRKYNWDPHEKIASHKQLDPERRTDPDNALNKHGITYSQFLDDVKNEMYKMTLATEPKKEKQVYWNGSVMKPGQIGRLKILKKINLWKRDSKGRLKCARVLKPGESYRVYGYDKKHGGQYSVGGDHWVTNMKGYVKYETPSKAKLKELNGDV